MCNLGTKLRPPLSMKFFCGRHRQPFHAPAARPGPPRPQGARLAALACHRATLAAAMTDAPDQSAPTAAP